MQLKISVECLISRLPALFAYYEWDKYGNAIITNAFVGNEGCYGKVVCNIKLPDTMNSAIAGVTASKVYTYNMLMSMYYQYREEYSDDPFIVFMETAIGKIAIDINDFNRDQDLVPSFVYLGNARYLLDWYMDRKTLCDKYNETGDFNKGICCKCDEYYRSGGDVMLQKLKELVENAKTIANECFECAVDDVKDITYEEVNGERVAIRAKGAMICVDLDQTIDDLGLDSPYINEWVGGKSYKEGEIIVYDENGVYHSYIVNTDITPLDSYVEEKETYDFFKLLSDDPEHPELGKIMCNEGDFSKSATATKEFITDSKLKGLRKFTGNVFDCTESDEPDDDEDWLIYYCPGYITEYNSLNDDYGNIMPMGDKIDIDVNDGKTVKNLYLYGSGIKSIKINPTNKTIEFEYYINTHLNAVLGDITIGDDGVTKYYYEDMFIEDTPTTGVKYIDKYTYEEGGEIYERVKKMLNTSDTDCNFVIDEDGKIGFFNSNDFYCFFKEELIDDNGTDNTSSDDVPVENDEIAYTKYSFNTQSRQTSAVALINGEEVQTSFIWTTGERTNDLGVDMFNVPTFKKDYYYGVAYAPEREIDVNIARGNASAFERHIRLSEVKTMEDLENYANGGYYTIANLNN